MPPRPPRRPSGDTYAEAIPAHSLRAVPWRNGGGLTREIGVHPPEAALDDFLWRISVADVAGAGTFSSYPGVDRTIVLTHGTTMILRDTETSASHRLNRWEPHAFRGETAIYADTPEGPTRDFNVMARRGAARAGLSVHASAGRIALVRGHRYLYCAQGVFGVAPAAGQWPRAHGRQRPFAPHRLKKYATGPALAPHERYTHVLEAGDTLHLSTAQGSDIEFIVAPLAGDARLLDVQAHILPETTQ